MVRVKEKLLFEKLSIGFGEKWLYQTSTSGYQNHEVDLIRGRWMIELS